ncbi:hypothetical protein LJR034_009050 [Caballeronia sp. LjRoot34]|uniref:hypothetical protein n=1 Tax=Caballeronia sp. LjRoot34 TaxID=3342325 RepID=UPI003ECE22C6
MNEAITLDKLHGNFERLRCVLGDQPLDRVNVEGLTDIFRRALPIRSQRRIVKADDEIPAPAVSQRNRRLDDLGLPRWFVRQDPRFDLNR